MKRITAQPAARGARGISGCVALSLLSIVLFSGVHSSTAASPRVSEEYRVKLAFVYNFTKFIQWPDSAFTKDTDPFVIGLVGDDPFASLIDDNLKNQTVGSRRIEIRRFPGTGKEARKGMEDCHLLFVNLPEAKDLAEVVALLKKTPALTIGDKDGFAGSGGLIEFYLLDGIV